MNDVAQKVYDDIMNGVARTGAELMNVNTYQELGWDMTEIWNLTEGKGYPTLKISDDITPGDVNNEGSVSVTDVGCTINYILEQVPSIFIFDAADMNGDKDISVTDVGMIINLILNEGAASRKKIQRDTNDAQVSMIPGNDGYSFKQAENLALSKEQFSQLDALDGNYDGKINKSIYDIIHSQ